MHAYALPCPTLCNLLGQAIRLLSSMGFSLGRLYHAPGIFPTQDRCAQAGKGHCRSLPPEPSGSPSNRMRKSATTSETPGSLKCNQIDGKVHSYEERQSGETVGSSLRLLGHRMLRNASGSKVQLAFKPLAVSVESTFKNSLMCLY